MICMMFTPSLPSATCIEMANLLDIPSSGSHLACCFPELICGVVLCSKAEDTLTYRRTKLCSIDGLDSIGNQTLQGVECAFSDEKWWGKEEMCTCIDVESVLKLASILSMRAEKHQNARASSCMMNSIGPARSDIPCKNSGSKPSEVAHSGKSFCGPPTLPHMPVNIS